LFPSFSKDKFFFFLFPWIIVITSKYPTTFLIVFLKKQDDCPICMTKLSEEPEDDEELEQ